MTIVSSWSAHPNRRPAAQLIDTLKHTLLEESLIVAAVCVILPLHVRSALVAILTLPIGILIAFAGMHALGIGSNIMSLGGIAIALGAMVDAAIVMIENAHKHVERLQPGEARGPALIAAARGVGPSLFFSLLAIMAGLLPILWSTSTGSEVMRRIAVPMVGGMVSSTILTLLVIPAIYAIIKGWRVPHRAEARKRNSQREAIPAE